MFGFLVMMKAPTFMLCVMMYLLGLGNVDFLLPILNDNIYNVLL